MNFISIEFFILFVLCFFSYHLSPQRLRKLILLAASCIFIGYYNLIFLIVALGVSLFTYVAGILIERSEKNNKLKPIFFIDIILIVGWWIICRNSMQLFGSNSFAFPLGISFYSFQAIAYLTEIYLGEEKAEYSITNFMLYMLLFMKFLSGPIERPSDLLPQIKSMSGSYYMYTYGLKLIFVGLIKKLIIADHISPYVDAIFDAPQVASGLQLFMACMLYPIELYTDFSGYTDIAIGGAMLFGLKLSPNFNRPFTSKTTAELWRRWHMSLSFWVRDYVYLPLTSLLRGKGENGIFLSLLITFTILGIWHGTGITFIIYGLIQGIIIIYELKAKNIHTKLSHIIGDRAFTIWSTIRVYLLFALSLIFFKCSSLNNAIYFLTHISFKTFNSWKEMNIGMSDHICIVSGSGLALMFVYEYFMARTDILQRMNRLPAICRWSIYYVLSFALLEYGKIGAENFIYLQF